MHRPIRASIRLSAIRHNFGIARRHAGSARLWAVIKANAYGHGLRRVAIALDDMADGFALLEIEDALTLRESGVGKPILLLEGCFSAADMQVAAAHGLSVVVHQPEQIRMLAAIRPAAPVPVLLKLNSGMNRLGFPLSRCREVLQALRELPQVGNITLMTHFAQADDEVGIAEPLARFRQATEGLGLPRSLANSATLLRFPEAGGDWARPGIMLYGGSPMPRLASAASLGLEPAMTLSSTLIAVQEMSAGERVGYGGLYQAPQARRVGIVACGYADGYPRHAPTGTPILVAGRRTVTLGRVSMDMLAADITELPEAGIGSPVVLWGDGLAADEVADAAGTISYELFCALAPRVPVVTV